MSSSKPKISGDQALFLLEDHISHHDYLLISQFISRKDFSLESLEKIIANKTKKVEELTDNLNRFDQFDGVEIGIFNRLLRSDTEIKTDRQEEYLKNNSIEQILDRNNQFREVVSELISEEQTDLTNLIKIRDVYVDYLPEATLSPRSSRSELETSPTRRFNTSPTLSPRGSSPISSPGTSPLNTPRRILTTPHRRLLRKSKSYDHK